MNAKQTGVLLILLWLSGCAATDHIGKADATGSSETATTMEVDTAAESSETDQAVRPAETTSAIDTKGGIAPTTAEMPQLLTLSRLLERLDRVATLEPGSIKQQSQQMEARITELNPAEKYEFALLLTRKSTNNRSLNRAISIMDELREGVNDRIVAEILLLHRRYFVLKKQYRSERSKSIELEKKIERLKGLEQDLDKSNSRMQEPLNPAPGEPRQP